MKYWELLRFITKNIFINQTIVKMAENSEAVVENSEEPMEIVENHPIIRLKISQRCQ